MRRALVGGLCLTLSACQACFRLQIDDEGRPYPCDPTLGPDPVDGGNRPDGGSRQCAKSWRCGLEKTCHPVGDAGPFLCTDDSWCEGGWACRPDGVCAPFVFDGLKPGGSEGPFAVHRISPKLLDALPDLLGVGNDLPLPVAGLSGSGVAFTVGNQYTQLTRVRVGPPDDPIAGVYFNARHGGPLPRPARALAGSAVVADFVLVLDEGGVGYMKTERVPLGDASYEQPPAWSNVPGDRLTLFSAPAPYALVFGDAGLTVLGFPKLGAWADAGPSSFLASSRAWPQVLERDAGVTTVTRIDDFAHVNLEPMGGPTRHVLLGSMDGRLCSAEQFTGPDGGVVFQQLLFPFYLAAGDEPRWTPAVMFPPGAEFGIEREHRPGSGYLYGDAGYRLGRVRARGPRVALELEGADGVPRFVLLQWGLGPHPSIPNSPLFPFGVELLGPCQACPADGGRMLDFYPEGEQQPALQARCMMPDRSLATFSAFTAPGASGCSTKPEPPMPGPLADAVLAQTGTSGHGGWAGGHGQLWQGESYGTARGFLLDVPPTALVKDGDDLAAVFNRTLYFYDRDGGLGFVGTQGSDDDLFAPVASVSGKADWVVTQGAALGRRGSGAFGNAGGVSVAGPPTTVDFATLRAPYHAGLSRVPDGGARVLLSSNDAIFSAEVSDIFTDPSAPPGQVEFRIVPLTRVPIRSLAVNDVTAGPDGGAPYAHAWALARDELIEVLAPTQAQWRARPVPAPAGAINRLWADGEFARIGYDDGRVLSLPAQKTLADPLPQASRPVVDYLPVRGQVWAVAQDGLWRLSAPDASAKVGPGHDARGTWVKGPAVQRRDGGALDFRGARLFEAGDSLYLFTGFGWVYRLDP